MSWSSWSQSITKIAREAQRGIDKVLDISEEATAENGAENGQENSHSEYQEIDKSVRDESIPSKPDVPKANGWNNDGWDEEFDVQEKPKKKSPRTSIKKKTKVIKASKITIDNDTKTDNEGVFDKSAKKPDLEKTSPVNATADRGDESINGTKKEIIIPEKAVPSTQSLSNEDNPPEADKTKFPVTEKVQRETDQVQSILNPEEESSSLHVKPDLESETKSPKVKKIVEESHIKYDHLEAPPDGPSEVQSIDPAAMKASEIAISKLVEHSESLGNSFEILTNRLQSREEQLVKLSTSNADLLAQNDDLKSQLDFLNEKDQINSKELTNMKALEKEHQKLQDELHKTQVQLKGAKESLSKSFSKNHVDDLVNEKDRQISGLLEEGEKLSKQQLTLNTTIKKLRARVKESEEKLKNLEEKNKKNEENLQKKTEEHNNLQTEDARNREAVRRMTSEIEQLQSRNLNISSNMEDGSEKIRSLESTLDSAYKEITELQKQIIEKDSNKETRQKLEEQKGQLEKEFEDSQRLWNQERDQLHSRIQDLQDAQGRLETQFVRKEDNLKHELNEMQERINDSERRNHELSSSIQSATRPLLRQIENLQMTNSNQSESFETLEKQLNCRIQELQQSLAAQQESDRSARETVAEVKGQFKALQSAKQTALEEKQHIKQEYVNTKDEHDKLKIRFAEIEFDLERVKSEFGRYQDETKKDLILLKSELEKEKSHCETERNKRLQQEKENQALQRLWNYPATGGAMIERDNHTSLPDNESVISETLDNISISGVSQVDQTFSFDRSGSNSMIGPGIIETLQAQLKQREGEVFQFRAERTQAQNQREKLAAEVVRLSSIADEVGDLKGMTKDQKRQLSELNQKYSALLTLYGEKVEMVEELQLDLSDVKELLKAQTEEWAAKFTKNNEPEPSG